MEKEESSALGRFRFGTGIVLFINLAAMAISIRLRNAFL